ncbi:MULTISPECIES: bifunctional glutamate N-acetyltransferase/amino-acid acetyltransferase ArgJ [Thalassolituus]|jgi:glutamate N-acetyltransferase/amino-acid N-acetyltransferase|uniref:Arginine biosynthesis bifunctional protein ArgJ n=1 Tax=Thalassolituus oleivorans MIL-1 TaxID=1298593 RepID=M5E0J6_9GAMM|nr:bifunctional glutamate N-acetyltransferase/amino-acid acetyltransferase ArgJ [Thalassolituus oleivorans]PCI49901.1 MAG: bifunctional ornithine acetyltransferase/N-acetylglutamate synthase [Oceanospirillales bacterium]PHQ85931.1 MAG: bifunctional ornithine acetyltransferase/N-acetylglutamate synthase [Thalassobium sp.]APR67955.1 bifunctional ornithine acetyltransferase/N-acetylglutamate synthase [Thalassolituus oleivorans]MBQ0726421.1 bifunctional glutamate N-acetyltransferase/amino-acid acet
MAVNFTVFEDFRPVKGVRLGIAQAAVRYQNRDDMVILELAPGSSVAGVFTTNSFCAAPVQLCRKHMAAASARYMLINTGNANAGTGPSGFRNAEVSCDMLAKATGVTSQEILPFSTGVIGEPLNMAAFERGIPAALENLAEDNWARAAKGIMTTDTLPKGYSREISIEGKAVTITGISKGAGMIMPNMATMLGYIATDAGVSQDLLQQWCKEFADCSFNRITIDGDTSTNDSCMLIATGQSGLVIDDANSAAALALYNALKEAFQILAQAIVRDGEGATKFVTIQVDEAASQKEALDVAYTVAHSPLVKTAMFASDANWGRILAAVGRSGVQNFDLDRVQIYIEDVQIVQDGGRCDSYTEAAGAAVFKQSEFTVRIILGRGDVTEALWTTDLSHEYVTINANYRS